MSKHSCKNSGNRVPVWSHLPVTNFCRDVKIKVLHSMEHHRQISASFPCNKNTLTFLLQWLTHVLSIYKKDCPLPCNLLLFSDYTMTHFQVVNEVGGLVEDICCFRALERVSLGKPPRCWECSGRGELSTVTALKELLLGMELVMLSEAGWLAEALPTQLALVRPLLKGVSPVVLDESWLWRNLLPQSQHWQALSPT